MANFPNRIRELRLERGMTLEGLAEAASVSVGYLQRLETGERRLNVERIADIAKALKVPHVALLIGGPTVAVGHPAPPPSEPIMIVGEVAAGIWQEAEIDAFEPVPVPVAHDSRWKPKDLFVLRVRGNSINRQAPDGSFVLCLSIFAQGVREPAEGDWVIARRSRNGLVEKTVKQLRIGDSGRLELWPDSDDPKHQGPVAIGELEGEEVRIIGFVLDFIRPATRL